MDILWKDFKIVPREYSWDLLVKKERLKDTTAGKKGTMYYAEEGFYTKLDSLINSIMRLDSGSEEGDDITLKEFLFRWENVVNSFVKQVDNAKK